MKKIIQKILTAQACLVSLFLFAGCASTSIKSTWKAPDAKSQAPQKVAVVADEERMMIREALEARFVNQLVKAGQPATVTAESFPDLTAARKDKAATIAKLRAAGADAILITRLVSQSAYLAKAQQRFTGQYVALTVAPDSEGWDASIGSFSTYSGAPRSDDRSHLLLDTSLYDLGTGQRIWACLTETTVKETDDRLQLADEFVAKVVETMRRDAVIR